jgi:hypothetical protein
VADAIILERKGIPAAMIGVESLVNATGRAMARAHGCPDYPIAVIPSEVGVLNDVRDAEHIQMLARTAFAQVEAILLGRDL